jgi:hypothetical protein
MPLLRYTINGPAASEQPANSAKLSRIMLSVMWPVQRLLRTIVLPLV